MIRDSRCLIPLVLLLPTLPAAADPPRNSVPAEAVVVKYAVAVMEDLFDDGSFVSYDAVTLKFTAPKKLAGKSIRVYFSSTAVADNSPLRRVGRRCRFDFDTQLLQQRLLFLGALDNLKWLKVHRRVQVPIACRHNPQLTPAQPCSR